MNGIMTPFINPHGPSDVPPPAPSASPSLGIESGMKEGQNIGVLGVRST